MHFEIKDICKHEYIADWIYLLFFFKIFNTLFRTSILRKETLTRYSKMLHELYESWFRKSGYLKCEYALNLENLSYEFIVKIITKPSSIAEVRSGNRAR